MTTRKLPLVAVLLVGAACGRDDKAERPPAPPSRFGLEVDPGDRTVVAEVDGRPVYGDCVARQAAAEGLDRRAALEECIDFELLAQEAERRGFLGHREVQAAGKRETVRALIDGEFRLDSPDDLPRDLLETAWKNQFSGVINRPEIRVSFICRAWLDEDIPEDHPDVAAGERRVRELAAELRQRTVEHAHFARRCAAVVGDDEVLERFGIRHSEAQVLNQVGPDLETTRPVSRPGEAVDETYAEAVFAIPAEGQISAPTRTRWGWEVSWLGRIEPEIDMDFQEAEARLRERLFEDDGFRRMVFLDWLAPFAEGLTIETFPENLPAPAEALALEGGD